MTSWSHVHGFTVHICRVKTNNVMSCIREVMKVSWLGWRWKEWFGVRWKGTVCLLLLCNTKLRWNEWVCLNILHWVFVWTSHLIYLFVGYYITGTGNFYNAITRVIYICISLKIIWRPMKPGHVNSAEVLYIFRKLSHIWWPLIAGLW